MAENNSVVIREQTEDRDLVRIVHRMRRVFHLMNLIEADAREHGLTDLGDVLKRARREFEHPNFTSFSNRVEPEEGRDELFR